MMQPDNSTVATLHREYRQLTGHEIGLDYWRESCWAQWLAKGFTADDLRVVVGWLQDGIKAEKRNPGCLKFSNLIAQPDKFEEELVTAKAELRNKVKASPRQQVLRAAGRAEKAPENVRTPADILAGEKAFQEFIRLKENL